MHELSIVKSIIDIAANTLSKSGAHQIDTIELEIGDVAGVEFDALDFAWKVGVQNTVLEGSKKIIHHIRGLAHCLECHTEFEVKDLIQACPNCGNYFTEIRKGKELRVRAIEVS